MRPSYVFIASVASLILCLTSKTAHCITFEDFRKYAEKNFPRSSTDSESLGDLKGETEESERDYIAEMLKAFPRIKTLPYAVGMKSKSSQPAQEGLPRIIAYDPKTGFAFAFNSGKGTKGNSLETMEYVPKKGFIFREITVPYNPNKTREENPEGCTKCHVNGQPRWENYFFWDGFVGSYRDVWSDGEKTYMEKFNKMRKDKSPNADPSGERYRALGDLKENGRKAAMQLFVPDIKVIASLAKKTGEKYRRGVPAHDLVRELPATEEGHSNTILGHFLGTLNEQNIIGHIERVGAFDIEKSKYSRKGCFGCSARLPKDTNLLRPLRYAIGLSLACPAEYTRSEMTNSIPDKLRAFLNKNGITKTLFSDDTLDKANQYVKEELKAVEKSRGSIPEGAKFYKRQAEDVEKTNLMRYFFQIAGENLSDWSLTLKRDSLSFNNGYVQFFPEAKHWKEYVNSKLRDISWTYPIRKLRKQFMFEGAGSQYHNGSYLSDSCLKLSDLNKRTLEKAVRNGYVELLEDVLSCKDRRLPLFNGEVNKLDEEKKECPSERET